MSLWKNKFTEADSADTKLQQIKKDIRNIGNKDFPFLHQNYSVSSRIPCTDFTEWIIERLIENDTKAIKLLMFEIVKANPGLGTEGEWIEKVVDSLLSIKWQKYISLEDNALNELIAICIILSKSGGQKEFWLLEEINLLINALCVYSLEINPEAFKKLILKANNFINGMKKDATPSWMDFETYDTSILDKKSHRLSNNEISDFLKSKSVGSRLHFFDTLTYFSDFGRTVASLFDSTVYNTRKFGLNISKTVNELIESPVFISPLKDEQILKLFEKTELIKIAETLNNEVKKSWNKKKLYEIITLDSSGKELLKENLNVKKAVVIDSSLNSKLDELLKFKYTVKKYFELLCFAD